VEKFLDSVGPESSSIGIESSSDEARPGTDRVSPKSKTSFRYVQMLPRVPEELLEQWDRVKLRSEFIFPNRAWEASNVKFVTKALWPRLVERAEVPYRPLMQTHHSYATPMLQKGAPIDWLQKQMGHRNLTMLIRHYWRWINPGELSQRPWPDRERSIIPQWSEPSNSFRSTEFAVKSPNASHERSPLIGSLVEENPPPSGDGTNSNPDGPDSLLNLFTNLSRRF